jgi:hypothetical protein
MKRRTDFQSVLRYVRQFLLCIAPLVDGQLVLLCWRTPALLREQDFRLPSDVARYMEKRTSRCRADLQVNSNRG